MHSNENSSRILNSLISLLLSPLLMFGPAAVSGASAQDMPSSGDSPAVDAAGATIRKGNVRVDEITTGLEKPKSSGSLGKVVYRDGTVKIDKNEANPGADVKSGSMIEAGADGRALIVLKRKSAANAPLNPEDLLGNRKISRKKTVDKRTPAKKTSVSAQTKPKRKSQPGLSKGIDVKRVQYIALVGDAQAKLDNNEIAIETRDGEAIINQGTSRLFNLGPNSKMRVPSQPKNAITGTLCHGVLTGVAKPSTASGGPNIETSSGIVNFPSGGRFLVEASGSGQLQQCDEVKNGRTDNKGSGGIRVVSLDAPGRLILAQRPVPVAPVKKKPTEAIQDDPKDEKSTEKPITLSLSGTGSSEQEREKDPQEDGSSNKKTADNEKKSNDSEGSKKTADNEKKSNDSDGGKKTADNEKKSNDEDARKKTADNDKKFNDSDGGKKTADSEKKSNDSDTGKKTADTEDKQKSKGGKPTKSEDSPLDIDQGNDKFIGSDSPAAKGAEKRIALNDEKQHDGDGTRQPGEPAKDGKPPQSGGNEDSKKKSNDGDGAKKTADSEKKSNDSGAGKKTADNDKKSNDSDTGKKTADTEDKQKSKGGKPSKSEDSPLDIDQGKGNDKFIGSDSPAAKGAEKRIALNDEKQHDGDGTRQPGDPAKDGKPPQSGGNEDSKKKSNDGDSGKKTADNEKKSNDSDAAKKTADSEKKSNDSDGGKKTADSEKKSNDSDTGKKTADTEDKQKSKGGKPTKSEDSPLDIDQGKGNDKFIGSDSPAAKGAEKRIALNDEKQHDGDGTRQPGEPAKDGKPPQSGGNEDSKKKSNEGDGAKKTADSEKKSNDSDSGKKTADNEKKSNDSDGGKRTADAEDKQKSKGGKPAKSEDSPLDIDQGKGNDKFIGSDSPAAKGAEKRIALNDEKQHDGDGTRQPGEPAKDGKPPQSGSSGDGSKDSKVKQKTEGVLEFGAMEDVKAPELPDMKNMSEQQKKDVYKSMAEKTESAPAPKSLVSNLLGQTSSDPKLVASSDGLSGQSLKGNSDVDGGKETTNKKDSDGSTNGSNAAEGQDKKEKNGSDSEKSKDPNSEDSSKSSDSGKKKSAPLISPPKMSPPPPPKIDATQMPLSSDVLIKLRKKVK